MDVKLYIDIVTNFELSRFQVNIFFGGGES
jgi:hypothetical protein